MFSFMEVLAYVFGYSFIPQAIHRSFIPLASNRLYQPACINPASVSPLALSRFYHPALIIAASATWPDADEAPSEPALVSDHAKRKGYEKMRLAECAS